MNKKIKECENVEFLPEPVRDSKKLDEAEKNILGTLCFYYLNHSIYASKHDGWFFKEQKSLFEESYLSEAQGKRVLLKLVFKRLIERTSGTNHKCTHYRLCKEIRELMPQNPENDSVDLEAFANEPLDKNRLDESSKDEDSRVEENVSLAPTDEGATTHEKEKDWDAVLAEFRTSIKKAKTAEELLRAKETFVKSVQGLPLDYEQEIDSIQDIYNWRYAELRNTH
jgi:hypothetical protein